MAVSLSEIKSLKERLAVIRQINDGHKVVLGTLTVKVDSPGFGFPSDKIYMIDELINSSEIIKWAVEVSISKVYSRELDKISPMVWASRTFEICVDMHDKDYTYWKLANEQDR